MVDQRPPNAPLGDSPDERENPALTRLLERLRQIDANGQSQAQRGQSQRHVTPPARPQPPPLPNPRPAAPARPPGEPYPNRFGQPPVRPTARPPDPERQRALKNAAPLPINTRGEESASRRKAQEAQAQAARREIAANMTRQATHAVDMSNRMADRSTPIVITLLVVIVVSVLVRLNLPENSPAAVLPVVVQTNAPSLIASTIPTTTPAPQVAVLQDEPPTPQSIIPQVVLPTEPDIQTTCRITALPVEIMPQTIDNATGEPTLTIRALVSTEDCEGRALRVSLWPTRADGQPMRAPAANSLYRTEAGHLTVQARVSVGDGGASSVVLELPHDQFALAAGTHQITGYVNVRDWETNTSLHDVALEPFTLIIAP